MALEGTMNDPLGLLSSFALGSGRTGQLYSLPTLEKKGFGKISRLPVCLRVILESLARHLDGQRVSEADLRALASWQPNAERTAEVPFVVSRVLLQDFTGVPLLVDLAAMRSAVAKLGQDPKRVEPLVPVDLVIDHSVQIDVAGTSDALARNMEMEFARNHARYQFLKWGTQAFQTLRIIPPGFGICHQVNLEYLAKVVAEKDGVWFPDTLVGTDSHTTMVNGLGVLGWGVGGIEAEAAMLGQPTYFLTPDVVGVALTGSLREGVTATDLVLTVTELLRAAKVVGKLVEFHGEGARALAATTRATIANMAPEYGATAGYFPVDEQTLAYLESTGRTSEQVAAVRAYCQAQGLFGIPLEGECDYSTVLKLDLSKIVPSVSGPKRPQDRIALSGLREKFLELLQRSDATGFGKSKEEAGRVFTAAPTVDGTSRPGGGQQDSATVPEQGGGATARTTNALTELEMMNNRPTPDRVGAAARKLEGQPLALRHGDVLIASITSCTNTSNPDVMLAAGLLAKKAVERGLTVPPFVKTSLAPGSRLVTTYLEKTGLQRSLDALGFQVVGYGCATCIGNSGPLDPGVEALVTQSDLVGASVLSGNRNFEARIHQSIKANFLASPPLVVAFALAGTVAKDLDREPIGKGRNGEDVFLRDIWPTPAELQAVLGAGADPAAFRENYADPSRQSPRWQDLPAPSGHVYAWDPASTYIQDPPYFSGFSSTPGTISELQGARPLAIFGDSVTTDHISPAGSIKPSSPAGVYLESLGVEPQDFNSYGSRRGNDRVMVRGTFANVRIKNLMVPGVEGGVTVHQPSGKRMAIYDAAEEYHRAGTPLVVVAGQEYGTGSSRDWAAKGTLLLGVRAVVARSFERIHRSNLVGMGVLPCQFAEGVSAATLGLDGSETFDLTGFGAKLEPRQKATLTIHRASGKTDAVQVTVRIDTPIEVEYYRHGGIMPYVLRQIARKA
jgi:aconitate hydratase